MSRVVGRHTLLSEVRDHLGQGRSVVLYGPTGVGKSALLDHLATAATCPVLRAAGAAAEHSMPYAVLQDLFDQLPDTLRDEVPDPLRGLIDQGLVGTELGAELRPQLRVPDPARPVGRRRRRTPADRRPALGGPGVGRGDRLRQTPAGR